MACLSRSSYTKRKALNRLHLVYKRSISLTNLASGVQNWRFVYKYAVFNLQTSISPYKLASRITTQRQIAELEKKTKRLQIDKSEKLREKKREERKARNHRLIQMGAVIESVLGRPITDEDIPRLLDLLRFLEDEDDHYFSEAMNGVFDYRSAK